MSDEIVKAMDRLELAAMSYERLGKLKKDDEKSRVIRIDTISELANARINLIEIFKGKRNE